MLSSGRDRRSGTSEEYMLVLCKREFLYVQRRGGGLEQLLEENQAATVRSRLTWKIHLTVLPVSVHATVLMPVCMHLCVCECLFVFVQQLVSLFARVAHDCIGYINWQPYTPKV